MKLIIILSLAISLLTGCSTLADVQKARGSGPKQKYEKPYDLVWEKSVDVILESKLQLVSKEKEKGEILAERPRSLFSYGEHVGVFLEEKGNTTTIVEVVSRKKVYTNVAKNWTFDVFEDLGNKLQLQDPVVFSSDKEDPYSLKISRHSLVLVGMGADGASPLLPLHLKYDFIFLVAKRIQLSADVGLGLVFLDPLFGGTANWTIPQSINFMFRPGKFGSPSHLETSLSFIPYIVPSEYGRTLHPPPVPKHWTYGISLKTGYRFQELLGGTFFKLGFQYTWWMKENLSYQDYSRDLSILSGKWDRDFSIFPYLNVGITF